MTRSLAVELAEVLDLLEWQIITCQMQQGVEEHGSMPTGKNKPVTSLPFWVTGTMTEVASPKGISHRRGSHGESGMTRVGLLYCICCKKADGVDSAQLKFV